jgi:hypothetical protein
MNKRMMTTSRITSLQVQLQAEVEESTLGKLMQFKKLIEITLRKINNEMMRRTHKMKGYTMELAKMMLTVIKAVSVVKKMMTMMMAMAMRRKATRKVVRVKSLSTIRPRRYRS